jgi:hypothetical protein
MRIEAPRRLPIGTIFLWTPSLSVYRTVTELRRSRESGADIRARIASARIRQELAVSDEILSQIIAGESASAASGMFTEAERQDIDGDNERIRQARAIVFLTGHGSGLNGFEISCLADDHERAERVLRDRFGEFATIRYDGASNHTFRPMAFGSRLADEDRLHLFYGLPRNGERAAGGQVFETEHAVIVALTILDWRGAKTLYRRLYRLTCHCRAASTPRRSCRH